MTEQENKQKQQTPSDVQAERDRSGRFMRRNNFGSRTRFHSGRTGNPNGRPRKVETWLREMRRMDLLDDKAWAKRSKLKVVLDGFQFIDGDAAGSSVASSPVEDDCL